MIPSSLHLYFYEWKHTDYLMQMKAGGGDLSTPIMSIMQLTFWHKHTCQSGFHMFIFLTTYLIKSLTLFVCVFSFFEATYV